VVIKVEWSAARSTGRDGDASSFVETVTTLHNGSLVGRARSLAGRSQPAARPAPNGRSLSLSTSCRPGARADRHVADHQSIAAAVGGPAQPGNFTVRNASDRREVALPGRHRFCILICPTRDGELGGGWYKLPSPSPAGALQTSVVYYKPKIAVSGRSAADSRPVQDYRLHRPSSCMTAYPPVCLSLCLPKSVCYVRFANQMDSTNVFVLKNGNAHEALFVIINGNE